MDDNSRRSSYISPNVSSDSSPALGNPSFSPPIVNDFDLPIVVRKDNRSCDKYSMDNFVSYQYLSPSFHRFSTGLSSISVPCSVVDALSPPLQKTFMYVEMIALEKNDTWNFVYLSRKKVSVCCN